MLRTVPKSLRQVAVAIQVSANLATLTLEDATGRLRAAEEAEAEDDVAPPPSADGKLLLTMEQWERARGGDGCKKKGGRSGGRDDSSDDDDDCSSSTSSGRGRSRYRGKCFDCGVRGHKARDCQKKKERAMLADVEEEAALL